MPSNKVSKAKKRQRTTSPLVDKGELREAKKKKKGCKKQQLLQPQIDSYLSSEKVLQDLQNDKDTNVDSLAIDDPDGLPSDSVTWEAQGDIGGEGTMDSIPVLESASEREQPSMEADPPQMTLIQQMSDTCLISAHTLLLILERLGGIGNQVQSVSQNISQLATWCKKHGANEKSTFPLPTVDNNIYLADKPKNLQLLLRPADIVLHIPVQDASLWSSKQRVTTSLSQLLGYALSPTVLQEFFFLPTCSFRKRIFLSFDSAHIPNNLLNLRAHLGFYDISIQRVFKQVDPIRIFKMKISGGSNKVSRSSTCFSASLGRKTNRRLSEKVMTIQSRNIDSAMDKEGEKSESNQKSSSDLPSDLEMECSHSCLGGLPLSSERFPSEKILNSPSVSHKTPSPRHCDSAYADKSNADTPLSASDNKLREASLMYDTEVNPVRSLSLSLHQQKDMHRLVSASGLRSDPPAIETSALRLGSIFRHDPHFDSFNNLLFPSTLDTNEPEGRSLTAKVNPDTKASYPQHSLVCNLNQETDLPPLPSTETTPTSSLMVSDSL